MTRPEETLTGLEGVLSALAILEFKALEESEPDAIAHRVARISYEDAFEVHRAVSVVSGGDGRTWIFIADNHPYRDPLRREAEHALLRDALRAMGHKRHVASARYPVNGEAAGYTTVMLLSAPDFPDAWEEIILASFEASRTNGGAS
jgi:hypothetical protein